MEQIENKRGEIIGEYAAAIKELWKRHTSDEYNEKTKFLFANVSSIVNFTIISLLNSKSAILPQHT